MRIISGQAGGIQLKVPDQVARPTSDRVREALFSMLGELVLKARVLDLFAGSGALGLECLSRGAGSALFVEQHGPAAALIQTNLTRTRLPGGKVLKADAYLALKRLAVTGEQFDLVFADPPYTKKAGDTDHASQLLASEYLRKIVAPDGWVVLETMVTKRDSGVIPGWEVIRDRAYGSTRILLLQLPTRHDGENSGATVLQFDPAADAPCDAARGGQKDESPGREVD